MYGFMWVVCGRWCFPSALYDCVTGDAAAFLFELCFVRVGAPACLVSVVYFCVILSCFVVFFAFFFLHFSWKVTKSAQSWGSCSMRGRASTTTCRHACGAFYASIRLSISMLYHFACRFIRTTLIFPVHPIPVSLYINVWPSRGASGEARLGRDQCVLVGPNISYFADATRIPDPGWLRQYLPLTNFHSKYIYTAYHTT